jgi:hypothetical protein
MKFHMVHLGYRETPDYPYGYRIELFDYSFREREDITNWLEDNRIPHVTVGWNLDNCIYLKKRDAMMFALRWA